MPFADKCVAVGEGQCISLTGLPQRFTGMLFWLGHEDIPCYQHLYRHPFRIWNHNLNSHLYYRHALSPWLKLIFSSENTYQIIFWKAAFLLLSFYYIYLIYAVQTHIFCFWEFYVDVRWCTLAVLGHSVFYWAQKDDDDPFKNCGKRQHAWKNDNAACVCFCISLW